MGLWKGLDDQFVQYSPTKKGALQQIIPQVQSSNHAVSVGEIATELALTSRSSVSYVRAVVPAVGNATASGEGSSASAPMETCEASEADITTDESDASSEEDA